jgi:hypothetical protein
MIRAPPSVITGGGVCCFRPLHPLWHRRDGYGLQAYAEARKRALQGFLTGEGTSPSITPSAFLDALMAAMTCGTIFDRASYSYASKTFGSLSKIFNHSRGSLPRQSRSWWGNFCSGSVPKPRQIRRRDYPVLTGSQ